MWSIVINMLSSSSALFADHGHLREDNRGVQPKYAPRREIKLFCVSTVLFVFNDD
jgi:hypothetical protein